MRYIVFGAGNIGRQTVNYLTCQGMDIVSIVDNSEKLWGKMVYKNIMIAPPCKILEYEYDRIAIGTELYYQEIKEQLINEFQIEESQIDEKIYSSKNNLLDYYAQHEELVDGRIKKHIEHINKYGLSVFNDLFEKEYKDDKHDIIFDENAGLYYVLENNKRIYMSRRYISKNEIEGYYKSLKLEQDEKSPHKYVDENFGVEYGDIVLDAGAAEGNFGLSVIEKVKRLYLVESDEEWVEALKWTFAPYKSKVTIINKYLTFNNELNHITIDEISANDDLNFIKMDLEGGEADAILGGRQYFFSGKKIKMSVCSYHNHDDEQKLRDMLSHFGFHITTTEGYMVFLYDFYEPKKFVKGIVRGEK